MVYEGERQRARADAGLGSDGEAMDKEAAATGSPVPEARSTVTWRVVSRGWRKTVLEPTPETAPAFARRLVLIDRGARGGTLRAFGEPDLDGRRKTINGVSFRFAHRASLAARLRRDRVRFEASLTPTQVRELRGHAGRRAEI